MQEYEKLRIVRKIWETTDCCTFELATFSGDPIYYAAGQFITLVFATAFGEKRRSYSFSSAPFERTVCITVKRVENGEFSRLLLDKYSEGDVLYSVGVAGQFGYLPVPDHNRRQLLFLAAGSGITPCLSIIKEQLRSSENFVCLYYSASSKADVVFFSLLESLREQFRERFELRYFLSDASDFRERRLSHYLLSGLLQQDIKVAEEHLYCFLCGPYDYMQMGEIALRSRIDKERIRKELFDNSPRQIELRPPDLGSYRVNIWQGEELRVIRSGYPDSILKSALKAGLVLPYSCSAGRCAACIATCVSGKVWMAYNEVLTDAELEQGRILTCQSFPQGGELSIKIGD